MTEKRNSFKNKNKNNNNNNDDNIDSIKYSNHNGNINSNGETNHEKNNHNGANNHNNHNNHDKSKHNGIINDAGKNKKSINITQDEEKRAIELKDIGNQKYSSKDYYDAIDFYSQAIEIVDKPEFYGNRAAAYLLVSKYEDALNDCLSAVRLDISYRKGYIRGIRCYRELGKLDDAKRFALSGLQLFPNDREVKEQADSVDICFHKLDKIKQRLSKISHKYHSLYDHIINSNDNNIDDLKDNDYNHDQFSNIDTQKSYKIDDNDSKECDIILSMIQDLLVNDMSQSLDLKCLHVETLIVKQDYENALTEATILLRSNPNYGLAIKIRAIVLFKNGHHEPANKHIKVAMSQDPDNKEIQQLFRTFKNILRLKEEGNEAIKNEDYDKAIIKYHDCIASDVTNFVFNSAVYCNRAVAWLHKEQYSKACNDCTLCLECDPNYIKAYARRAKAYFHLTNYQQAVNDAEMAYKLDPHNDDIKQLLRKYRLELKKSKRKNYYEILCIDKNSDEQQIRKGFRAQAMKWHPDKFNTASEDDRKKAEEKFKEIGEAYEVLKDPKLRERYDAGYDIEDIKNGDSGNMGGFSSDGIDISHIFDLLEQMRGGGGGGGTNSFSFRFG